MKRNDINTLISLFNKIHNNKYDYSKSKYINNRTKLEIICPVHGSFWQEPCNHIKGHGCPYCTNNKKMNNTSFAGKSKIIHGDLYNYDLLEYRNNSTPVKIVCKKHGIFLQSPNKHLLGRGCPVCGGSQVLTKNEFEKRSRVIHGDLYNYDLVEYKNARVKVRINCPTHGIFLQKPNNHLSGYGCLVCKSSKGEIRIGNYLKMKSIAFAPEHYLTGKDKMYIDFYLPEYNIGIEYDGIQHFYPIEFFGGKVAYDKTLLRDKLKNEYCLDNNIILHRIPYTELDNIEIKLDNILNC